MFNAVNQGEEKKKTLDTESISNSFTDAAAITSEAFEKNASCSKAFAPTSDTSTLHPEFMRMTKSPSP